MSLLFLDPLCLGHCLFSEFPLELLFTTEFFLFMHLNQSELLLLLFFSLAFEASLLDYLNHAEFVCVWIIRFVRIKSAPLMLVLISVDLALVFVELFLLFTHGTPILLNLLHYQFGV